MKKLLYLTGLLVLLAACSTGVVSPKTGAPGGNDGAPSVDLTKQYVLGQVIIGYRDAADLDAILNALGGSLIDDWTPLKAALVKLPDSMSVEKALGILERRDDVRYATPNRLVKEPEPVSTVNTTGTGIGALADSPYSDPDFDKQWMHRQMNTPEAWDAGVTGAGVRIAIHDDFIDHTHPDLQANIAYPGFYGTTGELICPDTPHNGLGTHGTSVAGTAAAVANDIGGRGIAYGASIVPIAIDHPVEGYLTLSGIVYGGFFAVDGPSAFGLSVPDGCGGYTPPPGRPYVDVLNMSWGGGAYDQVIKDLMDWMLMNGIVLVTSAGNTPTTGFAEPAWHPGLITVAATRADGRRTDFSNRGVHLDVAAPGQNIWVPTTRQCILDDPTGASCTGDENDYTYIAGTSFSSPATAGTAALILEAAGGPGSLDARQVRAILTQTAWDANADTLPGFDEDLGWGIVDAGAAVAKALAIAGGSEPAPDAGANVYVDVVDLTTGTPLPMTSVTLQPVDADGNPLPDRPLLPTQTTGTGLFGDGTAMFLQIDPGYYRVMVGGPHKKSGVAPGTAEGIVQVSSGDHAFVVPLDITLPSDPYEPNDDTANATPVTAGTTYKGILQADSGTDVDYYALNVTSGQTYVLNTETLSGNADLVLTLLDDDGTTVIAQNDSNQDFTDDAWLEYTADADKTVYIIIQDANGGSSPFNAYALDIASPLVSETEPNGSATVSGTTISNVDTASAQTVALGTVVSASIDPDGDDDIFAVTLTAGTTLVADVEAYASGAPDTMLAVYDSNGDQVAFNDDFTGRESRLEFTPGTSGTYYVLVTAWDGDAGGSTTGDYVLSLTLLDTP
ncbi:S8 family serine peptidase [Oceanithermus desulfurans]|uniref:Serine protease n=2 Tax=Oceanithermus desulfurans TaxID=227924 RepID=A0A511RHL6_9DEIN|nr:S8 family serine peptidase [Oceanithermus desulfurans]MBB6030925.1 subtilisin family serine protease [Oceanithermus desulfurans]GEM88597.1 serine protease [Oceanithermus desulfurans NBRC 100063]